MNPTQKEKRLTLHAKSSSRSGSGKIQALFHSDLEPRYTRLGGGVERVGVELQ